MKQTPDLDKAQRQMRPHVITEHGFLGPDPRPLVDILVDDDAAVKRLNLTHAAIARRMRELRDAGRAGLGQAVAVPPHFLVTIDSFRGRLPCPFGHTGLSAKLNTTVTNTALGRTLTYSDLNLHMLEAHGFYEGRGSPFRLDPADLATILEITPDAATDA